MSIKWCPQCNVPIIGEICEICNDKGQYFAKDIKPIFDEERKLFQKLLNVNIPSFSFRYRNRIIVDGLTFLTFKIDWQRNKLMLIKPPRNMKQEEVDAFEKKIKLMIKANKATLRKKEKMAINTIKTLSEKFSDIVVLFGGGKDSAVTAILAKQAIKKVPLLFIDTTLEFPETYYFVKEFSNFYRFPLIKDGCGQYYSANQNFFKLCERLGHPSIYYRWCCHIFKEQPVRQYLSEYQHSQVLFSSCIRRTESRRRIKYSFLETGKKITGQIIVQPILNWRDIDIWLYTLWKGIKINRLYELGHNRVGCWPCPGTSPIIDFLRKITHPNLWRKFEKVLCSYASRNGRSNEWIRKGLWRLRKPIRKKLLIQPLYVKDEGGYLSFTYKLPYEKPLPERFKVLGKLKKNKNSFIVESNDIKVQGRVSKKIVTLRIRCVKTKYVENKNSLEKILSRALNCVKCGACTSSCPKGALQISNHSFKISGICDSCRICLKAGCIMDDSERLTIVKVNPFILNPCEEGFPMNHLIFPTEKMGKFFAKKMYEKGINVEIHEKGKIVCIEADVPKWKIEKLVMNQLSCF